MTVDTTGRSEHRHHLAEHTQTSVVGLRGARGGERGPDRGQDDADQS